MCSKACVCMRRLLTGYQQAQAMLYAHFCLARAPPRLRFDVLAWLSPATVTRTLPSPAPEGYMLTYKPSISCCCETTRCIASHQSATCYTGSIASTRVQGCPKQGRARLALRIPS